MTNNLSHHSYRKAMQDPAIADVWKTAFGKEFGELAQGDYWL
jgi:hypothetical protein